MRGIVVEERRGKETDRCPLTIPVILVVTCEVLQLPLKLLVYMLSLAVSLWVMSTRIAGLDIDANVL
jgi:hypothetical protein